MTADRIETAEALTDAVDGLREEVRSRRSFMRDHAIAHHGAAPWTDAERAAGLVPLGAHQHGEMCRYPEATVPAAGLRVTREAVETALSRSWDDATECDFDVFLAALGVTVVDGEAMRETEAAHAALCDAEADRLALVAAREEVERLGDIVQTLANELEGRDILGSNARTKADRLRAGIECALADGNMDSLTAHYLRALLAGDL